MRKKKTGKLKIGFDLDGVLVDFTDEFVSRLNSQLLFEGREHDLIQPPVEDYWFLNKHLDFFEQTVKDGIFRDCLSYPESVVYVNKLIQKADEYEVFFVTARGTEQGISWSTNLINKIKRDTRDWVHHYFPTFDADKVHFCHRKDGVIFDNGMEAFVEDRADTATRLTKVCKSFLLERDWNKHEDAPGTIRIKSLAELDFFIGD